ncbi:MAG: ABC transporter permease, partial [Thermodesulfobacteriota bacterium]
MNYFQDSLLSALLLIRTRDPALVEIVLTSLRVSLASTCIAAMIGVPLGFLIAIGRFPGKRGVVTALNTLLALPTVVIGLMVYTVISRRGILGALGWLYTQKAIVIGQVIMIVPIVAMFTLSAVSRIDVLRRAGKQRRS